MNALLPGIAAGATLSGLFLLYRSWKRPGHGLRLATGWMILIFAGVAWTLGNGDRGLAQGVSFAMSVTAGLIVMPALGGMNPATVAAAKRSQPEGTFLKNRVLEILSGFWTFLLAGPVAGGAAFYASAAGFRAFWQDAGNPATPAVLAIVSSVVLWALLSALLLMERQQVRRTLYAVSSCALAYAAATL
jgi:hypothetical protein